MLFARRLNDEGGWLCGSVNTSGATRSHRESARAVREFVNMETVVRKPKVVLLAMAEVVVEFFYTVVCLRPWV